MTNSTSLRPTQMSPRFPLPKHEAAGGVTTDAARVLKRGVQADYVKEYEDTELTINLESALMNWAGGPASHFDKSRDAGRQGPVYNSMISGQDKYW